MRKIRKRKTRRRTIRTISGANIYRPCVNKRKRLILGEGKRKKQRGGFIAPIVAALAPAAIKLVSKLFR